MFSEYIDGSRLSVNNSMLEDLFSDIECDFNYGDSTFVSTLKILAYNRIKSGETICIRHLTDNSNDSIEVFKKLSSKPTPDSITYIQVVENFVDDIVKNLSEVSKEWEEQTTLRVFFNKQMKIAVFINKEFKSTLVFVEKSNYARYHLTQSMIPRLLPWIFEDAPLTDGEKNLLKSLTKKSSDEYIASMESLVSADMRKMALEKKLEGFEKRAVQSRINSINVECESHQRNMSTYMKSYHDEMRRFNEKQITVLGLRSKLDETKANSEVIEFIAGNNAIDVDSISGDTIRIYAKSPCDNFNTDIAETVVNNYNSYIYYTDYGRHFNSREDRKRLISSIWSKKPRFKARMVAYYELCVGSYVDVYSNHSYPDRYDSYLRNPHIDHHSCLGSYRTPLEEAVRCGDLITAITLCIASAGSINSGEEASAKYFISELFRTDHKVLEDDEGNLYTPKEALELLKKEEVSADEQTD